MAEEKPIKPGYRFIDLTGRTFGDWTVKSISRSSGRPSRWNCVCTCGTERTVIGDTLRLGTSKSCGHGQRTHGMKRSREYRSWSAAKTRCFNEKTPMYVNYGARGITMSDEWRNSFEAFLRDMGPRPKGYELDRIDNDGPYTGPCEAYPLGNCRWTTRKINSRHRRSSARIEYAGMVVSLIELAELTGIKYSTLKNRHAAHKPLLT